MNQIDTASALSKMDETWDYQLDRVKTFGLRVITQKGFKEYYNARKNVKLPQQQGKEPSATMRGKSNKKLNGTVLIYDQDLNQTRDIFFDNIVAFRDYNSSTWTQVRLS